MATAINGEKIFQDIVVAVLEDLVGTAIPMQRTVYALAKHATVAAYRVINRQFAEAQPEAMVAVSNLSYAEAHDIARRELDRTSMDQAQKDELVNYLAALPMTSRQALRRSGDDGHVTTMVSQVPQSAEEMAKFVPIRAPRFQPNYKLEGHDFKLDTLLGMGGFAEVWKAYPTEFNRTRPVALKFCFDKVLLAGLKNEIRALDTIGAHDPTKDFVQLMQTNFTADPPFLVFEYMDGGSLVNWVEGFGKARPQVTDVVSVMKMATRAMQLAHENGIVHRDLKPANLMMSSDGRVKITDFGIGYALAQSEPSGDDTDADISKSAYFPGAFTPMYADPMKDPAEGPHPRDDVYALGVIFFQLLMGSVTYKMHGNWQSYLRHADVDHDLIRMIETCTAPRMERYENAGAMLAALERFGADIPADNDKHDERASGRSDGTVHLAYCTNCGAVRTRGHRFCTNCGTDLTTV
ncbi:MULTISPECIES: protein kinase [unclassified Roseovarius]|uniref:protein kinase domain-containing protein n=1 Tax=unclassified Roseovarius TaxID=2614913 RepID=UPI00273DFFFF|nr:MULTISPECIES: protein kinase [unclassified Roseovarius]